MHMRLITIFFLYTTYISLGQTMSGEPIEEGNISEWKTSSIEDYEGSYSFGFSEAESQLLLTIDGDIICAQLRAYEWRQVNDEESVGWYPKYTNFTGVRIKGNNFYSDQSNGTFVKYGETKCLKLLDPIFQMGEEGDYELGAKNDSELNDIYSGKYPATSYKLIDRKKLESMTSKELQIMRNEIFARYGHIFRSGGKMDAYFQEQSWYKGFRKDVTNDLTDIERKNISAIREIEKQKRSN